MTIPSDLKGFALFAAAVLTVSLVGVSASGAEARSAVEQPGSFAPSFADVTHHSDGLATSTNWSGYLQTKGGYHSVSAMWTMPTGEATNKTGYSAQWIGIDGFNSKTDHHLIQVGTEVDTTGGSASYYAWWEIVPATPSRQTVLSQKKYPVSSGDDMIASIAKGSGGNWTIQISNGHWIFTKSVSYSGPEKSVEWIDEAPNSNGILPMARTTDVTFWALAENGSNPKLTDDDGLEMKLNGTVLESPTSPAKDGDAFSEAYGASPPQVAPVMLDTLCSDPGSSNNSMNGCPDDDHTTVGSMPFLYASFVSDNDASVHPSFFDLLNFASGTCQSAEIAFGIPNSGGSHGDSAYLKLTNGSTSETASVNYGAVTTFTVPLTQGKPWRVWNSASSYADEIAINLVGICTTATGVK